MSCNTKSTLAFERTILVTLLTVKSQMNRIDQSRPALAFKLLLTRFNSQVKTLTLVGILIMIVAVEKYTLESVSIPTEYI